MPRARKSPPPRGLPASKRGLPAKHGIPPSKRADILRLLLLGWKPAAIANECGVSEGTVYRIQRNLLLYGSVRKPGFRQLGRPLKLTEADEDALFEWLLHENWREQEEMVYWLWHERGVTVTQATVSRTVRRRGWSRQALKQISSSRSEPLRQAYIEDIGRFSADDLVFLDESIFNEKTGWRTHGYGQAGRPVEHHTNIARGKTWSICAAMTLNGWLPCTGIKEGYWSTDDFLNWIQEQLLPTIEAEFNSRPMVIVLDNVSIHIGEEATRRIEAAGHLIRFLPPYSPDFNPIELTFSVLEALNAQNMCGESC
jgi:transposase